MASYNNNRKPDINTGYPGFAYNFDATTQTCDVQLAIENLFIGMVDPYKLVKKDRLIKVPVRFIQGGSWSITHPVPDGTPVYVHFAQRGTSHYFVEGKDSAGLVNGKPAPQFSQLFSHNAAVAEVGLQPFTKAIKSFKSDVFELRNADRSQRITFNQDGSINLISGSANITLNKDGAITITSATQITAKAPKITLDGDTTVTKSLTVQGGAAISGGSSGQTFQITGDYIHKGNATQTGSFTLNGIKVDGHNHTNPEGGNTGPMKAG